MSGEAKKQLLLMLFMVSIMGVQPAAQAKMIFYHNDGLGSPVMASNMQGKILWTAAYRPYGDRDQFPDDYTAAYGNKRWYTGHVHNDALGLTYMQARYYDPVAGRFVSVDPLGFSEEDPQTFNRYAYARNNPYKYFDPNGRDSIVISWSGTAAIGGGAGAGTGIYLTYPGQDQADFDFGTTATVSGVLGADVSFIGSLAALRGGRENIEGTSVKASATIPLTGIAGPSADFESIINKDTGKWAGQAIGMGVAAFPSASAAISETVITFSARDWLQSTDAVAQPRAQPSGEELDVWYQFIAN